MARAIEGTYYLLSSAEIADLYQRAKRSQRDSVVNLHACGLALRAIRESLAHGEWLLWLKNQQSVLGFSVSTAQRLVRLANEALTPHLTEEEAVTLSRKVWSNDPELAPAPPVEFSAPYRRITGFLDWISKHSVSDIPDAELLELKPRIELMRQWLAELEGKAKRLNLRLAG